VSAELVGVAVGIPLALGSVLIAWMMIRAIMQSQALGGIGVAVVPLAMITLISIMLYAADVQRDELGAIASVGVGALAALVQTATRTPPPREETTDALDPEGP
jgi:citrate lyase alpha subunit